MLEGVRLSVSYANPKADEILSKLRPCPFCGRKDGLDIISVRNFLAVECSHCNYELPIKIDMFSNNMDVLTTKWNLRKDELNHKMAKREKEKTNA